MATWDDAAVVWNDPLVDWEGGVPMPPIPFAPDPGDAVIHLYLNQGPFPVKPVIWFIDKDYGYDGDTINVVGMGFSRQNLPAVTQDLWFDPLGSSTSVDFAPERTSWESHDAGEVPGPPQISPGGVTTTAYDVIRMPVATAMLYTDPELHQLYIRSTLGWSNRVNFATYPRFVIPIPTTPPVNTSKTITRIDVAVPWTTQIAEDYVSFTTARYVVSGRYPEAEPTFMANLLTYANVTGDSATEGLDDPVKVLLHYLNRFRPDDANIESRPDLGTTANTWVPNGAATQRMVWYLATSPYVDENVTLNTRTTPIVRPALIFDGVSSYARALENFNVDAYSNMSYTMTMAVRLFTDPAKSRVTLMCTDAGQQNQQDYLVEIAMVSNNLLQLWVQGRWVSVQIPPGYLNYKALLITLRATATSVQMTVNSQRPQNVAITLTPKKSGDVPYRPTSFYLGRNNDPGKMNLGRMELFDFMYHPSALTDTLRSQDLASLDSVYGGGGS